MTRREAVDVAIEQAERARNMGDLDGAFRLLESTKGSLIRLHRYDDMLRCLEIQENILRDLGALVALMDVLEEHERFCRKIGKNEDLAICLVRRGTLLKERKSDANHEPDFALLGRSETRAKAESTLALFTEAEQLFRELNKADGLAISLINEADLLVRELQKPEQALPLAEEADRLARQNGLGISNVAAEVLDMCKEACEASQELERLICQQKDG